MTRLPFLITSSPRRTGISALTTSVLRRFLTFFGKEREKPAHREGHAELQFSNAAVHLVPETKEDHGGAGFELDTQAVIEHRRHVDTGDTALCPGV